MEGMEETKMSEAHLTSAVAFVEGGIQDACDDACSICLEAFCESDPSTITSCKHEFHLQCILEWCQRSSQCPMCWQPISLKDPTSQELLEAVERERSFRFNPARNATIFHHPTLGDFELSHLPVGANDAELEERIIQHLAAAAAMGRRHIARREGQRNRSSAQGRPQFLVFSGHPNSPPSGLISSPPSHSGDGEPQSATLVPTPSSPPANASAESWDPVMPAASDAQISPLGSSAGGANQRVNSLNNSRSPSQSSPVCQDQAGPSSDFQSFSESVKSKFNAFSMRYRESISKSTRGWRERFFPRNTTMTDPGSEVKREVNAGVATVSPLMGRLEIRESDGTNAASISGQAGEGSIAESDNQKTVENGGGNTTVNTGSKIEASSAASSGSN